MRRFSGSVDRARGCQGVLRRLVIAVLLLGFVPIACASPPPPPAPRPAVKPADETPDVIKIAVRFVEREKRTNELVMPSAFVKSQDFTAYYVGFERKLTGAGKKGPAVVKVHKQDGWAEWEDY